MAYYHCDGVQNGLEAKKVVVKMANYIQEMRKLVGTQALMVVGAMVAVFNEKGEVLLQQRADVDKWGFPGGVMEYGESLEETALRELFEETGLKAKDLKFIDILSGEKECHQYPNGDEIYGVTAVYTTSAASGELSINDGESRNIKFFPLNNLPSNMVEKSEYIIRKFFASSQQGIERKLTGKNSIAVFGRSNGSL